MDVYSNLENDILIKLKESGLIDRFLSTDFEETPNLILINKLFTEPVEIFHDEGGIFYYDENGDKLYCPIMKTSVSEQGEWISDKIPSVNFDIEQGGNVRKADEAEALFCCIVVSQILKEDIFKNEVLEIAKTYDFENMINMNDESITFRSLLNDWQNLQSVIINILISACRYKIFDFKKDVEKYLKDGVPEKEIAELRDLQAKIRSINFKFSEGELSPTNIKSLSKIRKLEIINKRDDEISAEIAKSKSGVLFKILNLSSEYISPIKKKKISLWVRAEVDKTIKNEEDFAKYKEDRTQIISKIQRRALRFEKNSVRKLNVEKYLLNKEAYKFPVKM